MAYVVFQWSYVWYNFFFFIFIFMYLFFFFGGGGGHLRNKDIGLEAWANTIAHSI